MTIVAGLAGLVGVLLGLMGGGGSILAVPLFIYLGGQSAHGAIRASLLVVGASALVAVVPHALQGQVRWRVALVFAGAGALGASLTGRLAHLLPGSILLVGFGLMMIFTGIALFRCRRCDGAPADPAAAPRTAPRKGWLLLQGFGVGAVTGLVGVGGGFLIVPALTLFAGLSTRQAVGSSLLVIAVSSLAGFLAHHSTALPPTSWVLPVLAACMVGSLLGSALSDRLPQRTLRRALAIMVVAIALVGFVGPPVISGTRQGAAMIFDFFFKRASRSAQAHKLVEQGAALVDVRSPEEYAAGHLPGAVNIPVSEIERRASEIGARTRAVVVYCRSGARSARAASALVGLGFAEVLNLGPSSAW